MSPAPARTGQGTLDRLLFLPTVAVCSAFHSSIVKVLPEASFACFCVAILKTDKETRGVIPEKGTRVPGFVFSKEKPTEVCLLEVAYPSFSAALVLCHRPSIMSRVLGGNFLQIYKNPKLEFCLCKGWMHPLL